MDQMFNKKHGHLKNNRGVLFFFRKEVRLNKQICDQPDNCYLVFSVKRRLT